jgi:thiamine-monophosphate kinase
MKGEFKLIDEIKKSVAGHKAVFKGIGDDCAVVRDGSSYRLYTVDAMVEGVHFDLKLGGTYKDAGYKAVARAVSDIAAMGGAPLYLLLALAMPKSFSQKFFDAVMAGFREASKAYGVQLIGGDMTSSPTLCLTVTVIGECDGKPVLRSGANEGDLIYVSGFPGMARAGLEMLKNSEFGVRSSELKTKSKNYTTQSALFSPRSTGTIRNPHSALYNAYLRPVARIQLGKLLREQKIATSMIDISDGLLGDLSHILAESKKGAVIYKEKLPVSLVLKETGFLEKEIIDFILNGGDDYELIFTANPLNNTKIAKIAKKTRIPLTEIGIITKRGLKLSDSKIIRAINPHSFEHF